LIRKLIITGMVVASGITAGCGSDPVTQPDSPTIVVLGGNNQQGEPGSQLGQLLRVRVHENGLPVVGVEVTWQVIAGGGTIEPLSAVTDAVGDATARYTLGPNVGGNTIRASAAGATGVATFTATATNSPAKAQLVAEVSIPANYGIHDTHVRDGIAFVAAWNSGIWIYDVGGGSLGGSPASPKKISQYVTAANGVPGGAQVHNSWWFHNPVSGSKRYLFVGQEGPGVVGSTASGDLHVVDISDMANPVEVAFLRVPGAGVHNFWMDEASQVLYAAWYNGGVVAVDVSGTLTGDLSSRIIAQSFPGGEGASFTWGVMLSNGTLYAADMVQGFFALDPVTLQIRNTTANVTNRYTSDLWVHGNVGYTGTWGTRGGLRGNAINIWQLGGNGVPTFVRSQEIPGAGTVSDIAVTPDGKLLVATVENGNTVSNGLHVFRRSDPLAPTSVSYSYVSSGLHTGEVAVIDGRTYIFGARNPPAPSLMIFDITSLLD